MREESATDKRFQLPVSRWKGTGRAVADLAALRKLPSTSLQRGCHIHEWELTLPENLQKSEAPAQKQ